MSFLFTNQLNHTRIVLYTTTLQHQIFFFECKKSKICLPPSRISNTKSRVKRISKSQRTPHKNFFETVRETKKLQRVKMTTLRASIKMFGGRVQRLTHRSAVTKTDMDFTVFVPPQASSNKKVPTLYWLSGLTYVFFKSFTFTQIFNTLDIQPLDIE